MDNVTRMIPSLKQNHVHVKNWGKLEEKLLSLIQGKQHLQIIADFDFTLTKFHINGEKYLSTYGVVEAYSNWPFEFKEAIKVLKEKYYWVDSDLEKSSQDKIPILMYFLKCALKIVAQSCLKQTDFKLMVEENPIPIREGVLDFFEELHRRGIPILIISAGLGNVILQVLKNYGLLVDNLKIVANYVLCDSNDEVTLKHGEQVVHPYNKQNVSLSLSDNYFKHISYCHNVILLGDSLGDLHMSRGVVNPENILTIGFLNEKVEQLEQYMENFDIVLVDDQTMDIPNSLIKVVL